MTEMTDELALGRIVLALKPEHRERAESAIEHIAARLRAAPQPPAEAVELTVCCGREECGGECGNEWRGMEWVRKAGSPPAEAQAVAECGERPSESFGPRFTPEEWDRLGKLPPGTKLYAAPPSAPVGVEWTDEQIIDVCEAAGVNWLEADEEEGGFPGGFDITYMPEMRRLFAALAQQPSAAPVGVEGLVAEMRNFADVADRCQLTEGNASAAIRAWADRLAALSQQPAAVDAAWQKQLADALDYFWNAAIRGAGDGQGNVIGGMVEGFAAVAEALRKHAPQQGGKA